MARVMKKGAKLAVMTYIKCCYFGFKLEFEKMRKSSGVHVFYLEEIDHYLSQTGFKGFDYHVYGSALILFSAEKAQKKKLLRKNEVLLSRYRWQYGICN
jgi:hypothetical protein